MTTIIKALTFIHSKCLIHRDLKSDNIVVSNYNDKYVPMIIDFGKCIDITEHLSCKVLDKKEQDLYIHILHQR